MSRNPKYEFSFRYTLRRIQSIKFNRVNFIILSRRFALLRTRIIWNVMSVSRAKILFAPPVRGRA